MPPLDVSFAINVRTGEEHALLGSDGLAGIAADFSVLGIDAPPIRGRDFFENNKAVHDLMDAHGWVFAHAFEHYHYGLIAKVEPVSSADLAAVLGTLVERAGAIPVEVTVVLREAGSVDLKGADVQAVIDGEPIPDAALARCAGQARRIASVMDALSGSPYADRVTVFGSVARGKPFPNDLDIVVDARGGADCDLGELLRLARMNYGAFDPFVLADGGLYARDESATRFVMARSARTILASIREDGIPLAQAARPSMELPDPVAAAPSMR